MSKWDRPPDPHDWRYFVGGAGKVLITIGLLLFGFVAYQLWGTGIETARTQNRLENEFEQLVSQFRAQGDIADDGSAVGEVDSIGPAEPIESTDPPTSTQPVEPVVSAESDLGEVAIEVDLADEAVDQVLPPFERGDPLALLEIPAIGRRDVVVPGVRVDDLKSGPGHYPDTPLPGQLGNASIAGHRTTYGAPFFDVDQLVAGDELIVTMINGDRFVYEVTGSEIVAATDYWVVTTRNPRIAELTLTSCHPKYTARDRIVVHSVLNPAKSSTVGVPTFYDLGREPEDQVDEPGTGDDPVVTAAAEAPPDDTTDHRHDQHDQHDRHDRRAS